MPELEATLYDIADFGAAITFILSVIFIVSYASFFNWRKTAAGRAVLFLVSTVAGITAIVVLALFVGPEYWGRAYLRIVVWWGVPVALSYLLWVLWKNYKRGHQGALDLPDSKEKK